MNAKTDTKHIKSILKNGSNIKQCEKKSKQVQWKSHCTVYFFEYDINYNIIPKAFKATMDGELRICFPVGTFDLPFACEEVPMDLMGVKKTKLPIINTNKLRNIVRSMELSNEESLQVNNYLNTVKQQSFEIYNSGNLFLKLVELHRFKTPIPLAHHELIKIEDYSDNYSKYGNSRSIRFDLLK